MNVLASQAHTTLSTSRFGARSAALTRRSRLALTLPAIAAMLAMAPRAGAAIVALSTAGNFAVLGGSTVTNAGASAIAGGDVGVSPGTAITGFPPGTIAAPFTEQAGNPVAARAEADLATAYATAAGLAPTRVLTGQDLGGLTLSPGVYSFGSTAQLTGTLTLDDQGDPNAQFVFQIGSTLTSAVGSSVVTINGGTAPGSAVFWQVGSSATLGSETAFEGHILAFASITLETGATLLDGSALALNGAVTLDSNAITNAVVPVPEPMAMGALMVPAALLRRHRGRWPA
jgi:type VI secretion system secreted protein VgrG